jgi:nucleotide-binding universal stress UspA family protein
MSQTFIAAYDGSDAARAAAQLAVQLAGVQDAEVSAVHVYARVPPAGIRGGVLDPEFEARLRDEGRELLDALDVEGIAHRVLVMGSPAQALHEMAEREEASLIAVGATHHGQLGRLVPRSVGSKLLHGAPCPVLVVPAEPAPGPIRRIVAAYDESEQAEVALREAVRLAQLFGARLDVVGVHDPGVYAGPAMVASHDLDNVLRGQLRERVEERAQSITGVELGTQTEIGDAGRVLSRAAEGADLLVTGSRGFGPLHSVLVGSVSRHLVDHAPCPVLVLPRGSAGAEWTAAREDAAAQPADL